MSRNKNRNGLLYRRTEQRNGYKIVTEVDENGRYEQRTEWPDGSHSLSHVDTLARMGWSSIHEFLTARRGFYPVPR